MLEKKDLEMIAEIVNGIVQPVRNDVEQIREDVEQVKEDVEQVREDVEQVNLTLENETNRNIQIIAEGHLDLSRKLNEALKMKEDDEMIKIRLNRLESEMEILKKKIG